MTEAELLAQAAKEARATTLDPDRFLNTIRNVPGYDYKQAHWYKAMMALEQLKKPPTPPPPPPPPASVDLQIVRNLLIVATPSDDIIDGALSLNPRWRVVFSADPAYRASDSQIQRVKAAGRPTGAWGDCHSTLPPAIKAFQVSRELQHAYGQCENAGEFSVAREAGLNEMVGKADAVTPAQLALIANATVRITHENYRNVNPAEKPDWRNANQGIGGNCGAVYASSSEGAVYTSVKSQLMNGWFGHWDSWYTEGFQAADWQALREMG